MKLLNFVIKAVVICTYEAWETVQEMCICQWDWMIPLTKTLRCSLRSETILGNWKPSKSDEKCFLFYLKRFFRSEKI